MKALGLNRQLGRSSYLGGENGKAKFMYRGVRCDGALEELDARRAAVGDVSCLFRRGWYNGLFSLSGG